MLTQTAADGSTWDVLEETRTQSATIESCRGRHQHAKVRGGLLEPKVLHDMWMVEVLESLTLRLESLHYRVLSRVVLVAGRLGQLNLLDCDHLARCRIERKVDPTIRALPEQFASNPFESGCTRVKRMKARMKRKTHSVGQATRECPWTPHRRKLSLLQHGCPKVWYSSSSSFGWHTRPDQLPSTCGQSCSCVLAPQYE